ncbi:MAG: LacI family DNA-binding transcriptional regulator [Chthoniobacteraceae bacterium]
MKITRQPTIIDVAEQCGYSKSTVSLVLQGSSEIPLSTQAKVMEAVSQLGYRQNRFARGLRTSRSQTIGMVIQDHLNPFYSELVQHVEILLRQRGFDLIISSSNSNRDLERKAIEQLIDHHVDGMIVSAMEYKPVEAILRSIEKRGIACVVAGPPSYSIPFKSATISTANATHDMMEHLVSLGHSAIAFIWGAPSYQGIGSRFEIFCKELADHGLPMREDWVVHCGVRIRDGYNAAKALLAAKERPTAIFALNDILATGVMRAAKDLGLRIPEDLSVVGVDDVELSTFLCPSLTTVSLDVCHYADALTSLVLETIEKTDSSPRRIELEAKLVIRESTGPVPRARASRRLKA